MGRPARIALQAAAAAVGLLLLIGAALFLWVDPRLYQSRLEAIASRALGLELRAADRLDIDVFPALRLTLADVSLHRRGAQVATVKRVTVGVEWLSLLGDELRVDTLVLVQPVLTLERDREGRFNVAEPAPPATPAAAQSWPEVSLSAGRIVFVDQRGGLGFEARDCHGRVQRLHRAAGTRAELLKALSFDAEIGCAQLRREALTLLDVQFRAEAKDGIVEIRPLTARLFDAQGSGRVRADFSAAVASYRFDFTLAQFPVEAFFAAMAVEPLATGRMDFTAALATRGATAEQLQRALSGQVSLSGRDLVLVGTDLDAAFDRFEASQTFSLVDVGAVFFAGPAGLLVTKGYDFASLARGNGGRSEIRTLVSQWQVEHGQAQALDVAMATKANRLALHGRLDLVGERFDDVSVALVDARGCARVTQKIRGTFQAPVVEQPNLMRSLAGPVLRLLEKGRDALSGTPCEVFYAGSVPPP